MPRMRIDTGTALGKDGCARTQGPTGSPACQVNP